MPYRRRKGRFYRDDDRYPPRGTVAEMEEMVEFYEYLHMKWKDELDKKKKEEEDKKKGKGKYGEMPKFTFLETLGILLVLYVFGTPFFKYVVGVSLPFQ